MLTANKMKQFKKDRLFQNDYERVGQLSELLKRVRVNDNQVFQKTQEQASPISPRPQIA